MGNSQKWKNVPREKMSNTRYKSCREVWQFVACDQLKKMAHKNNSFGGKEGEWKKSGKMQLWKKTSSVFVLWEFWHLNS